MTKKNFELSPLSFYRSKARAVCIQTEAQQHLSVRNTAATVRDRREARATSQPFDQTINCSSETEKELSPIPFSVSAHPHAHTAAYTSVAVEKALKCRGKAAERQSAVGDASRNILRRARGHENRGAINCRHVRHGPADRNKFRVGRTLSLSLSLSVSLSLSLSLSSARSLAHCNAGRPD